MGTLTGVVTSEVIINMVFFWMEHESLRYMGTLVFDDPLWCRQIKTILESHVGYSIREIGDLDLSSTL